MGNSDEVVASSEFHLSDICHVTECTAAQTEKGGVCAAVCTIKTVIPLAI